MKRPWQVWLLFAACVLAALAGMAWLTQQALRADEQRRRAESGARLEQRVSLALWRMDTELAPIIAEEVIRPPAAFRPGEKAVAPPQYVLLQFEARGKGHWVSPQVPTSESRDFERLAELRKAVNLSRLTAELPKMPLPTVAAVNRGIAAANAPSANTPTNGENSFNFFEGNTTQQTSQEDEQQQQEANPEQVAVQKPNAPAIDFQQRGKRYQSAAQQSFINAGQRDESLNRAPDLFGPGGGISSGVNGELEQVGVSRPIWAGTRLILARLVTHNGTTVVQGSWLDWPALRTRLLAEVTDLIPSACLMHVNDNGAADPSRLLAGLPVRLAMNEGADAGPVGPTLVWALTIGWGAVLLAVVAAAFVLAGVMTLSERRAAFVSSVTHELRTPLTTFRMYAEMLARGMVPDAGRRQEYFNTLQREAERLTLLVENVLAYARLERGRRPQATDRVTIASLFERIGPRLKQRAEQANMQCELQMDQAADAEAFTTDQAVVEQILFNLVDNASKYARDAADPRIHVVGSRNGTLVRLSVRDHGPGIQNGARRMQPFAKSAQESAESAPGVGLGLALCQRLARELGGRLEIADVSAGGAEVSLVLRT